MCANQPDPSVVIGVDGSEQSFVAASYGLLEAEALGCPVTLVHAYTPMQSDFWTDGTYVDLRRAGEEVLHEFAQMLRRTADPSTAINTLLCAGDPADTLVQLSAEAMCIVVGRRRAGWLQHIISKSVSTRLSSMSWCPSVAIPQACARPSHAGSVAVVIDSVAEASACLQVAATAAERRGADLTVVHAAPVGRTEWPPDEDILRVAELVESARNLHPTTSITATVKHEAIDLVAVDISERVSAVVLSQAGSPNLAGWRRSALPMVLKRASCPVMAVPSSRRTARLAIPERRPHPFRFPTW